MGVVISPESELGKEYAKWEKPYRYQHYPLMLYKALPLNGKGAVFDPRDELFAERCQRIVRNAEEEATAVGDGWRVGAASALALYEDQQRQIADEAANVAYHVQRMSEKAQAEYAEASDTTHSHVTDVQPPRKPGWPKGTPRKPVAVSGAEKVEDETDG